MRALIAASEPSLRQGLERLLRRTRPDILPIGVDDLAGLGNDAELAIVAVNSLDAGDCEPAERINRVLARVAELQLPVIALVGWPEDGMERARAAGARAVVGMAMDVGEMLRAVEAVS